RALADLSHPNLAALYDLVIEERGCFFTMELVAGDDFLRWVRAMDLDPGAFAPTMSSSPSDQPTAHYPPPSVSGERGPASEVPVGAAHLENPAPRCDEARLRAG